MVDYETVACEQGTDPNGDPGNKWEWGDDDKLRLYPNPEIASSWKSDWSTNYKTINCTGIVVGPDNGMNPEAAANAARAEQTRIDSLKAGMVDYETVACEQGTDPKGDPGNKWEWGDDDKLRLYPNPEIASSWKSDWSTNYKTINCTGIVVGPDNGMNPEAAANAARAEQTRIDSLKAGMVDYETVACEQGTDPKGDPGNKWEWGDDDKLRLYPNPEIASSWKSDWSTNYKTINCTGIAVGPDNVMNPEAAANAAAAEVARITSLKASMVDYETVACEAGTDPKGDPGNKWEWGHDDKLRLYPNPEIASSWVSDWSTNYKTINCTGIAVGPDNVMNPAVAAAEETRITSLKASMVDYETVACEAGTDPKGDPGNKWEWGDDDKLRLYPNPEIASSWVSDWSTNYKTINCTGIVVGPDNVMNPAAAANAARAEEARIALQRSGMVDYETVACEPGTDPKGDPGNKWEWGNDDKLRLYPNPQIASSWVSDWSTNYKTIHCTGIVVGPDNGMNMNNYIYKESCDDLGGGILVRHDSGKDLGDCRNACAEDAGCLGFIHKADVGFCQLHDNNDPYGVDVCDQGYTVHRK
jgi:hypothetical protein